jgi:hypothetical protein
VRVERGVVQVRSALDQQTNRFGAAVHSGLVQWGEIAPAAGVDGHTGIEQIAHDVGVAE